jgi:glucosamine--fructose-6-phosphate aminotransferase (isomerizing)
MCGIFGYTGTHQASPILLVGLRRLEYRGYDSAGVAILDSKDLVVRKRVGRVQDLGRVLDREPMSGTCRISHTHWATHGPATELNAHPHLGGDGAVAVVHNGMIENHAAVRRRLEAEGFTFRSQTDTEVIAHLIARELDGTDDLFAAVRRALPRLEGTYGLAVLSPRSPGQIVGARLGSPLVVGVGEGELFLASDAEAIAPHTRQVAYLHDGEVVRLGPDDFAIHHRQRGPITPRIDHLDWRPDASELGGHAHYMLKEIREQPNILRDVCRGRLRHAEATAQFGGLNLSARQLRRVHRLVLAACGTSRHAALVGEYLIERLAHLPVEVEYASEFRYRNAPLDDHTLVFVVSQSGETADTLGALREARRRGHRTLGLCNVVGSTIARGRGRNLSARRARGWRRQHQGVLGPGDGVEAAGVVPGPAAAPGLHRWPGDPRRDRVGARCLGASPGDRAPDRRGGGTAGPGAQRAVSGAGPELPGGAGGRVEVEGNQLSARRGLPNGRDEARADCPGRSRDPQCLRRPTGPLHAKTLGNVEEVRARNGPVLAVGTEGDETLAGLCDIFLPIPEVDEVVQPLVATVPLQLLAYHVARLRGCDIDRPRNLAKSVTVE